MSSQTVKELDDWFENPDPWGYTSNPDDAHRRDRILDAIMPFARYHRALDIGAGEGFVTQLLPAEKIEAIEVSDRAASRFPHNVKRVHTPTGQYDLIIATGVLYDHYDWEKMVSWIKLHASDIILTSHYNKVGKAHDVFKQTLILKEKFPYRDGEQILKVYKC